MTKWFVSDNYEASRSASLELSTTDEKVALPQPGWKKMDETFW
ncbi:hypothetical protein ECDEC6B_5466 [Escherichia coli DEC6B]|nr:hypothetical protein ECDEC6B_5466 [Escherichia coli DEC6B]